MLPPSKLLILWGQAVLRFGPARARNSAQLTAAKPARHARSIHVRPHQPFPHRRPAAAAQSRLRPDRCPDPGDWHRRNTAIFSIFYAVLLQPLPYRQPDRLVEISPLASVPGSTATNTNDISYPNFRDWRDQARSFESIAAYHPYTMVLNPAGANAARNLQIAVVTSDFFHVLGVQPALGRSFAREEEKAGSHVVILSHELWVSAYHASPAILGASIKLSDEKLHHHRRLAGRGQLSILCGLVHGPMDHAGRRRGRQEPIHRAARLVATCFNCALT